MSAKSKLPSKPLPLSDVLRDLAVLRSSGQSIPEVFKLPRLGERSANTPNTNAVDSSVSLSYDYIREARAAIRLHDSGKVGIQGTKIEEVRTKYEELLEGLGEYPGNN
ncbi:hypothetical protein BDN70DRAFT_872514 [Pholiota conissans]|uniref:Uncharacterized protein n=1 Tax=Pholiota conissans TaxID=109636 RepID=A0A9P5ZEL2_9AGAR|nr:hypothetical protein BDN70DRAFT_872514 [Pholiota conissans]